VNTVKNVIVNGFEIGRVEGSRFYGCIKIGEKRGFLFNTKKAAVSFAKNQKL